MILDGHIHIEDVSMNADLFREQTALAGVAGGIVMSLHPNSFEGKAAPALQDNARKRLDGLFSRTQGNPNLYPFFWIDPLEEDAAEQVDIACEYGVLGFKVICDHYYPYEDKPMAIFRKIAAKGKPILFHSGILWDGRFSSLYNRPLNFEALIDVEGLRFSLAHASWPWVDECLALYGKMLHAMSTRKNPAEMFIDITPGTPQIYRKDLLTKLFGLEYGMQHNIVFGADCTFDDYAGAWVKKWIDIDTKIYEELGVGNDIVDMVFGGNLKRFAGVSSEKITHRPLTYNG